MQARLTIQNIRDKLRKKPQQSKDETCQISTAAVNRYKLTNMSHSPVSMALLFILCMEVVLLAITESFIIFYHTAVFAQCQFTLKTLGLAQADLIYHGIFIISPIYQLFLYMDALRQKNTIQLLTFIVFGEHFLEWAMSLLFTCIELGILMVIFSGIQTIQHMMFEQAGCDLSPSSTNSTTTTFPNATLAFTKNKLKSLVVIGNGTHSFQDNVDASTSNIRPFEHSNLAIVAIVFLLMLGGSYKLYKLFKWKHYASHVIPDPLLRNTVIAWSVLSGLLKIGFFYTFVYAIQLLPATLIGYSNMPGFECVAVFGAGLVIFLVAMYAIRHEDVKTLILFAMLVLGSIGYFGYRLFIFGMPRDVLSDPYLVNCYSNIKSWIQVLILSLL